jgi:hypothetical protein
VRDKITSWKCGVLVSSGGQRGVFLLVRFRPALERILYLSSLCGFL